jgi:hypothetical protein
MNLYQKPKLIISRSLEKQSLETPANQEQAQPDLSLPGPTLDAGDPITRLVTELSDLKKQVKVLTGAIQVIEKRGVPATADQVEQLLKTVKSSLVYKIDSDQIVQSLIPHLEKHGVKTVISVQDATYEASKQMSFIYEQEAQKWNARIGFTSWKAAVSILGTVLFILSACIWYAATQHERISVIEAKLSDSESNNEILQDYARWLDQKSPQLWESYKEHRAKQSKGQRGK